MRIYNTEGNLVPDVKDALVELCNAGTGTVSITIGRMLSVRFSISTPQMMPHIIEEHKLFKNRDEEVVAIFMHMTDTISGEVAFIISTELVVTAVESLTGQKYTFEEMMDDDCGFSAVQEFGNIVGSAYVKAIGEYTGIRFFLSPVMVGVDKVAELLSSAYFQSTVQSDRKLFVESEFSMVDAEDTPLGQAGYIVMMPDESSVEKLMESLGL